jgi:AraC-like DNA-binding protein
MSDSDISLLDALGISIKRIIGRYEKNWAIVGNFQGKSQDMQELPESLNEHFEEITGPENHIFTEICICFEGSLAMLMGEHIVNLEQGDVCFILPGVLHSEMPRKDNSYIAVWITINLNTIALHLSGEKSGTGLFYTIIGCTMNSGFDYNPAINSIKEETANNLSYSEDIVKSNIIQILISIYRKMGISPVTEPESKPWKESIVLKIQDYVETNYRRTLRLGDISQELCISPNYLNTIFKSITGQTIIRYTYEFKIKKARQLLKSTVYSISTLACELGYYDQYHFRRIFKKETGYTPTQYRKSG